MRRRGRSGLSKIYCSTNAGQLNEVGLIHVQFCLSNSIYINADCFIFFWGYYGLGSMQTSLAVKEKSVSVILLAGGRGKRMGVSLCLFLYIVDIIMAS